MPVVQYFVSTLTPGKATSHLGPGTSEKRRDVRSGQRRCIAPVNRRLNGLRKCRRRPGQNGADGEFNMIMRVHTNHDVQHTPLR